MDILESYHFALRTYISAEIYALQLYFMQGISITVITRNSK